MYFMAPSLAQTAGELKEGSHGNFRNFRGNYVYPG